MLKRTLGLQPNAANEYLYGSREDGLFGVPLAAEDSDIAIINGGFKLLTSRDHIVKDIAWAELTEEANYRMNSTRVQNPQDFLNSAESDRTANRYASQWTRARQVTERIKVKWDISENREVQVITGKETIGDRRKIFSTLRNKLRKDRTASLRDHLHQGKTNTSIAAAGESSHFFTDDAFTRFKDWRLIHRARLGLVKLKAYSRPYRAHPGPVNKKCRKCAKLRLFRTSSTTAWSTRHYKERDIML